MTLPAWLNEDGSIDPDKIETAEDRIRALAISLATICQKGEGRSKTMATAAFLLARCAVLAEMTRDAFLEQCARTYDVTLRDEPLWNKDMQH